MKRISKCKGLLGSAVRNTGSLAEVSHGFTGVPSSTEKDSVSSSGATEGQLVESQALTTAGNNASTSSLGESQGSHMELGNIKESLVVGHSSNKDGNLVVTLALHVASNTGNGHGGTVGAAHRKALEHSLVEGRLRAASQKSVKLHQQKKVGILRDWGSPVAILGVLMLKIDTLQTKRFQKQIRKYNANDIKKAQKFQEKISKEISKNIAREGQSLTMVTRRKGKKKEGFGCFLTSKA